MKKLGFAIKLVIAGAIATAIVAPPAHAGTAIPLTDSQTETAGDKADERQYTLTVSPALLLFGTVLASVEFSVNDKWSAAVQGALGAFTVLDASVGVMGAGGQVRRRLTGSFRSGAYLGSELLAMRFSSSSGSASTALVGPMLGYKHSFGKFTIDAHGGVGLIGSNEPMFSDGPDGPLFAVFNDHLGATAFFNLTAGTTF